MFLREQFDMGKSRVIPQPFDRAIGRTIINHHHFVASRVVLLILQCPQTFFEDGATVVGWNYNAEKHGSTPKGEVEIEAQADEWIMPKREYLGNTFPNEPNKSEDLGN
jgi:hypothetical protein